MSTITKKSIGLLNLCPRIYAHVSKRLSHFCIQEFSARFVKQNYDVTYKIGSKFLYVTDCRCCYVCVDKITLSLRILNIK